MANLEDVYIRIHLDSTNTPGEIVSLSDAVDKYKKKLQELQAVAKSEGRDERDDPEIQRIAHKLQNLDSLMKQNRKWFKDIEGIMGHLLQSTTKELKAALKQLNGEMNDLTRTGTDVAKIAEVQDRINRVQGELKRRGSMTRSLAEIQKDLSVDKLSILRLRELRQELETLKVTTSNANTRSGAIQEIAILDDRMKKMNAQPLRDISAVIANIKNANNGSITRLKELREELVAIQQTSTNAKTIQLATDEIAKLDARLSEMQKVSKRPIAEVLGEIGTTKSIEGLERLRKEIEALYKSSTNSGDQQKLAQGLRDVDAAIKKIGEAPKRPLGDIMKDIDAAMKNGSLERLEALRTEIGNVFRTLTDKGEAQQARAKMDELDIIIKNFGKETVNAFAVLRNPANFNLSQIEAAIKQLDQQLQNTNVGPAFERRRAFLAEQIRGLNEYKKAYEESLKAPKMTATQASDIANGTVTATVGQLKEAKEALEAFKQTLKTTDVTGLEKVNQEIKAIDKMLDEVNGKTKKVMNDSQASDAVSNLNHLIKVARLEPGLVDADIMKSAIEAAKQAQSATGISIKLSQEAAAAERVATEIMRGKTVAVISAAEAARAEANAQDILIKKEQADADTVRQTIELYKQMLLQEGMTVERRNELSRTLEKMEKLYKGTADAASKLAYDEAFVNKTLANIKTAPIKDLETAMKMLKQKMSEVNRETEAEVKEYVRLRQEYNKTKSALDTLNGSKNKAAKTTKALSTRIKEQTDAISRATGKLMQYLGVFGGFYLIRNQMEKVFEANMRYDDSLTNIRKTTQMTSEAVAVLANEIKHIDTRTSVEEMTNLAYAAGKLGVKGVSDVLSFVRAADQIKVALGEQLGDGAAAVEQIYKVANVMGDIQQYGMEEALEKVGSSINYLTMQTQATAQPMIDMMKRLAGVGRQAGMSTADLVGWAGATNALGQNTELAATALSRVMVQLSKNHKAVAQALNMTKEETEAFRYDISTGRMSEAMLKVLQMGKERGGLSQLGLIIKDLSGSDGARAIQVLSTLSSNYETVASMVRMSNNAFEEGTSVTDEYNLKQQNTTALLEKLKNGFAKLFTSTEYVDYINKLLRSMQDLPEAANRIVHSLSWLGSIFKNVIATITTFTSLFEGMANGLVWRMLSQGVFALSGAYTSFKHTVHDASKELEVHRNVIRGHHTHVAMLTKGYTGWQLSIRKVRLEWGALVKGFKAMGTAGMLNAIFLVATAVTTVWTAIRNAREESQKWTRSFQEDLGRVEAQSKITTASLNKIEKAWKDAGDSEIAHKDILIQLNSTYDAFIDNLIDEKTTYEDIAKAIKAANAELENKAILEARQNKITEIEEENADKLNENINSSLKRILQLATFEREIEEKDKNGKVTTKKVTVGYKDMTADEKQASAASIETVVQTVLGDTALIKKLYAAAPSDIDEFGRAKKYGIKGEMNASNGLITIDKEARENLKLLFRDLGIADTNENWKEVLYAMQGAVNVQTTTQNTQDDAMRAYNVKARAVTNATYEDTMDLVKESWLEVVDSVTKNGKYAFSRYSAEDEEVKKGTKKEGEAKPYYGKEQDNYYSDVKDAFGTTRKGLEQRKELSTKLERFIENAQRGISLLESRRYTDAAAQQQYEQLSYQLKSAQAEYKVVGIGKIDNVTPPGVNPARDARQEMDNLIQKIKTFYEIQANAYKEMRQKQQITETEYQRYLEQNNRDMSASLADAYAALAQDADMTEERYKQITERMRQENKRSGAGEIGETQIGIVSGTSYASVQNINKQLSGDKENGTAWTNSMRRKRREEEGNVIESLNKEMQARIKAWLEQNPLGKIAQDFQKQFEEMGLLIHIKPEVDADGVEIRNLTQVEDDLMAQLNTIGKNIASFDITDGGGVAAFRSYITNMKLFPDVAKTAVLKTDEDVKAFYYKCYEYAEQYQENVTKIVQKSEKMWDKMFNMAQQAIDDRIKTFNIDELQKANDFLQKWGWSDHVNYKQEVEYRKQRLALAQQEWEYMKKAAADELAAAKALKDSDPGKKKQVELAEAKVKDLETEPQYVLDAMGKLNDSMLKLRENTWGWTADLVKNFETLSQNIFALQSWYDINMKHNSVWTNAFGTKADRQKAFAAFMDDLKKTLREMIVERVRAAVTAKLQERMIEKAGIPGVSKKDRKEKELQDAAKVADSPVVKQATEHEAMLSELDAYHRAVEEKEEQHQQIMAKIKGEERQAIVLNPAAEAKTDEEKQNDDHASFVDEALKQEKGQGMILEGLKKGWKKLFSWKKKSKKEEVSLEKSTTDAITNVVKSGGEERFDVTQTVEQGITKVMAQQGAANIAQNDATNQTLIQADAAKTEADVALGTASGSAKTIGELGWWGLPLIAVISAALNALLSAAMNMVGGGSKTTAAKTKTKLVSGMLTYYRGNVQSFANTYDAGNVQSFRGIPTYDGGGSAPKNINMLPVMGDDGRVYMVPEGDMMGKNNMSGFTGIVRRPTLTTVGGAPALVAERGPEMVIGRETTHAMMMSRPDLLRAIVEFDRNRSRGFAKTFDSGNVSQLATVPEASPEGNNSQLMEVLDAQTAMLSQMYEINAALTAELRKGIGVRKYGAGGLIEETAAGFAEARRLGNNKNVTRLFGSR